MVDSPISNITYLNNNGTQLNIKNKILCLDLKCLATKSAKM